MGKRKWDERSALAMVKSPEVDRKRKVIRLTGNETITSCGAIDFLKNQCGYRVL